MTHILGLLTFVVTLLTHHAHKVKSLRAAGETSNERRGTFVFATFNLYAYCVYHSEGNPNMCPWSRQPTSAL